MLLLREGNDNPLQHSCLENPMDRGAWQSTVYGAARVRHNLATKGNRIKGEEISDIKKNVPLS